MRIVTGLALIGMAATVEVGLMGDIGDVPVITGTSGWCPLYTVLGINTCPVH